MQKRIKKGKLPSADQALLTPEIADQIEALLTKYIAHANNARASSRYAMRLDDTGCFSANEAYWRHGVGILRWVRGQFRRERQSHERNTSAASDDSGASHECQRRPLCPESP